MKGKAYLAVVAIILFGVGGTAGGRWYRWHVRDQMAMAHAAIEGGDLRGAKLELRTAIRNNSGNAEAHFLLGTVQLQLGDPVAAERELTFAHKAGWDADAVMPMLARAILAQARYKDVLRDFPDEEATSAARTSILVSRALAQLGLRDVAAAQVSIAKARRSEPDSVDVSLTAARIALACNDPAAAEMDVDRAVEISPRSVEALIFRGELQHARGHDEAALGSFDAALAVAPGVAGARLERANILIANGQGEKARKDIDAVLKADVHNPIGNYLLACTLHSESRLAGGKCCLADGIAGHFESSSRGILPGGGEDQSGPGRASDRIGQQICCSYPKRRRGL